MRRLALAAGAAAALDLDFGGARWRLLAGRAALHRDAGVLVVADAHFGKAAAFRARGVPVPGGTTAANLAALDVLLAGTGARTLVFLGDLFHARESHAAATLAHLAAWRARHAALRCVLVEGNHDVDAGPPPAALGLDCVAEPYACAGVALCHHPQRLPGQAVIAGHLHPTITLRGAADAVRLPCFWVRDGLLLLPAFGAFTGGAPVLREPGDRVIAVGETRLHEVPARRALSARWA